MIGLLQRRILVQAASVARETAEETVLKAANGVPVLWLDFEAFERGDDVFNLSDASPRLNGDLDSQPRRSRDC